MSEDLRNKRWAFDASDDLQCSPAIRTGLGVDRKYSFRRCLQLIRIVFNCCFGSVAAISGLGGVSSANRRITEVPWMLNLRKVKFSDV